MIVLSIPRASVAADPASLLEAVKAGNLPAVQTSLQQHSDPNQTEPDGTTPLHWAVQQDRLDMVQALISAGANVNAKNRYGSTPLVLAATTGNASVTDALLKAGADARVSVPETGSVLITAARTGNPEVIKLLLAAGADVNFAERYSGQTALMWAAAEGHSEAVKALLAGGAKVDAQAHDKKTALFFAVRKGDIDSVQALIAAGADVNARIEPVETAQLRNLQEISDRHQVQPRWRQHARHCRYECEFRRGRSAAESKERIPNAAGTHWSPLHALIRIRNYEETQFPPPKGTGKLDSLEFAKHLLAHGANPSARADGLYYASARPETRTTKSSRAPLRSFSRPRRPTFR